MTARRPSFWWILAVPATLLAILGLSDPVLFIWAGVGLILGWALAASWMWGVNYERAIRAESRLIFMRSELAEANRVLDRYKTDARVVLPIRPKPGLRVVSETVANETTGRTPDRGFAGMPPQRTGSHDDLPPSAEVDGFAWPEIAREAFPIRQWGEEAES